MELLKTKIASELYDAVFPQLENGKNSIFLLGGNYRDPTKIRNKLKVQLEKRKFFVNQYDIYYPEYTFAGLLYDKNVNLLQLENYMARSVHAIVLCVESDGSIAELGAFTNNSIMREKLIVVVDEKHKKAKSFIRNGPIRYLELNNNNPIIWFNFNAGDISELSKKAQALIGKITKKTYIQQDLRNPIAVEKYLLLLVYILGPVNINDLQQLVLHVGNSETISTKNELIIIFKTALGSLFNQRSLSLKNHEYVLTRSGYNRLIEVLPTNNYSGILNILDNLRVRYLDRLLRHIG